MAVGVTYSFKSLVGVLKNSIVGVVVPLTGGNIGLGGITIRMTTARTTQDVAADGTVMPSYLAGDNGEVDIEVQQSSTLNSSLLSLYNRLLMAAQAGNYTGWASTSILFTFGPDGSQHYLTGLSFEKFPDKPYTAAGQRISWKMIAANINSIG